MAIKEDVLNAKILIVEDDFLGRVVIKEIFKKQGFINVEEAENGKEALEKIPVFIPDIIILDVLMPKMDGVECCKQIRANPDPKISSTPIIFQTALDGLADKARFFEAGATDYLTKPIDPHEITARTLVHLEKEVMTRHLRDYKTRVSRELETARATQNVIIPSQNKITEIEELYNLNIHGYYQPCFELGGDFWGFKELSENELIVYTADFSGKGVNAALNTFRLHTIIQASVGINKTAGEYLFYFNSILSSLLPVGQFATMFLGIINTKNNTLSYSSAAAPEGVVFSENGKTHKMLKADGGTMLGAIKGSEYETSEIEFNKGDCLLLYSDALIETENEDKKMLSIEECIEIFQDKLKKRDSKTAFTSLLEYFKNHSKSQLSDDLTLSCYKRK